ncbi:MAG: electron transport complex subunit E [Vallitaleaceae bacterium]|jgi:electron transport complex protein RnfE|nr:electron transport complex subunit E [Vallitaleaceae bacterium]
MDSSLKKIKNGIIDENPIFVQVLGMCPTLAVTTSAKNGIGMGLATLAVLIASNFAISLMRNIIPSKVRIPAYIVIIASFVTMVDLLLQAYMVSLYDALGLFIPLIVVNCIVLGRAEAFASKNTVKNSVLDGLGMGLGFTAALGVIGLIREFFGAGELFGFKLYEALPDAVQGQIQPISILVLAPGAFIVMGILFAVFNHINSKNKAKAE